MEGVSRTNGEETGQIEAIIGLSEESRNKLESI